MAYNLLDKAIVNFDPYPHCIVTDALPFDYYMELLKSRPDSKWVINNRTPGENIRIDRHTKSGFNSGTLPKIWQEFCINHSNMEFWLRVKKLFNLEHNFNSVAMRFSEDAQLWTECQLGMDTPTTKGGRVKGPHLDHQNELYAGLFYMCEPDADLVIYTPKKDTKMRFYGKMEIDDKCLDEYTRVTCKHNTLVFFLNGPFSIHGATARKPCPIPRNLVNIIGEVKTPVYMADGNALY